MRTLCCTVVAFSGLSLTGSEAQPPRTNGIRYDADGRVAQLGAWTVRRHEPTLRAAISAYGPPTRTWIDEDAYGVGAVGCVLKTGDDPSRSCTCIVRWQALGLTAHFSSWARKDVCRPRRSWLVWFTAWGRTWRTAAGLRVGDPTSRIRALHRCAAFARPTPRGAARLWRLTPAAPLVANPRSGLVGSLTGYRSWSVGDAWLSTPDRRTPRCARP